jgi:hypothetical protein
MYMYVMWRGTYIEKCIMHMHVYVHLSHIRTCITHHPRNNVCMIMLLIIIYMHLQQFLLL